MDNTNENNEVDKDAERMLAAIRQTVLVTNMSLATALNTGFLAQYESDQGICNMALKPNNTAVVATTAATGLTIYQSNFFIKDESIGEQRYIYKCENEDDADEIWDKINDQMYQWSRNEIKSVSLE